MEDAKEKLKVIDRDAMKYLAVIPMAIGHFFGYVINWEQYSQPPFLIWLLPRISLFAPPVFFFFIAEGFRYTRSRKNYALRILIFAVITQIPYCLSGYGTLLTVDFFRDLNVFFTLFLGVAALSVWGSHLPLKKRVLLIVLLDAATAAIASEWMIFGIPIILGFHIFREQPKKRFIWFSACILLLEMVNVVSLYGNLAWMAVTILTETFFFMLAYFCVTAFYNGRKGRHPVFAKWFFYVFYPLHFVIIWAVKYML